MPKTVFPAEWDAQSAVMLTWPHEQTDWASQLDKVEKTFFEIALNICESQRLVISCQTFNTLEHIADVLSQNNVSPDSVGLFCVPSNDCWSRDHGPITIYVDNYPVLMDFHFNAWGNKFLHEKDNQITRTLHEMGAFEGADIRHVDYILEGGSIDSDGQGTILASSQCLLSCSRNPDSSKASVESHFRDWFGATQILWLDYGQIAGDDTDSHIDNLARFCDQQTICYSACDDEQDENYQSLKAMKQQLESFTTATGASYKTIPLPTPKIFSAENGRRLPATYTNFLIINDAVLVPVYATPADQQALEILASCFPNHTIKPVNCLSLLEQNGSLHCVTMQLPDGTLE